MGSHSAFSPPRRGRRDSIAMETLPCSGVNLRIRRVRCAAALFRCSAIRLDDGIRSAMNLANYRKGMSFGEPFSTYSLAEVYLAGNGVEGDKEEAERLFVLAVSHGYPGGGRHGRPHQYHNGRARLHVWRRLAGWALQRPRLQIRARRGPRFVLNCSATTRRRSSPEAPRRSNSASVRFISGDRWIPSTAVGQHDIDPHGCSGCR